MALALGNLWDGGGESSQELLELASNQQAGTAQLAAAMSLLKLDAHSPPRQAIDVVLDAVRNPDKFVALSIYLGAGRDHCFARGQASRISRGTAAEKAEQFLTQALGSQPPLQAVTVAGALLRMVFPEPIELGKSVSLLTERQHRVLRVLAENRHVWGVQSGKNFVENVDTSFLMRAYGLPDRFRAFVAFVRGEKPLVEPPPTALQSGSISARVKRLFRK